MPPRWEELRQQGAEPESSLTAWEINHSRKDGGSPSIRCTQTHTLVRCDHTDRQVQTQTHPQTQRTQQKVITCPPCLHTPTHTHTHTLHSVCQHHLNTVPSERTTRHCRCKSFVLSPDSQSKDKRRTDQGDVLPPTCWGEVKKKKLWMLTGNACARMEC